MPFLTLFWGRVPLLKQTKLKKKETKKRVPTYSILSDLEDLVEPIRLQQPRAEVQDPRRLPPGGLRCPELLRELPGGGFGSVGGSFAVAQFAKGCSDLNFLPTNGFSELNHQRLNTF